MNSAVAAAPETISWSWWVPVWFRVAALVVGGVMFIVVMTGEYDFGGLGRVLVGAIAGSTIVGSMMWIWLVVAQAIKVLFV